MPRGTGDCCCTKGRRLIASMDFPASAGRECDLTVTIQPQISRYGVNLRRHGQHRRLPTGLPFRYDDVLEASRTRRASPLLAGLSARITPDSGNSITRQGISLP